MCLFHLYRPIKIIIIVTGKIQPIGLATVYVKKKIASVASLSQLVQHE
jgi:hypothetical protein